LARVNPWVLIENLEFLAGDQQGFIENAACGFALSCEIGAVTLTPEF
jgi:hypothetical protein